MSFSDMIWREYREEPEGFFYAYLTENPDYEMCLESVWLGDELFHREEFPSSRLGEASRRAYIQAVLASVIRKYQMGA